MRTKSSVWSTCLTSHKCAVSHSVCIRVVSQYIVPCYFSKSRLRFHCALVGHWPLVCPVMRVLKRVSIHAGCPSGPAFVHRIEPSEQSSMFSSVLVLRGICAQQSQDESLLPLGEALDVNVHALKRRTNSRVISTAEGS